MGRQRVDSADELNDPAGLARVSLETGAKLMRFSLAAVALGARALVGTSTQALADQSPAGP